MSGVLRIPPVLFPVLVTMITGNPVSRSVLPFVPPLLSYSSTCSRTQSLGLGMYWGMEFSFGASLSCRRRRDTSQKLCIDPSTLRTLRGIVGPARRSWGYMAIDTLGADAAVTSLAAPEATIRVADLLP